MIKPKTTYRVVPQKDGKYAVEVTTPDSALPTTIPDFHTEAAAKAWVAEERKRAPDTSQRARSIVDQVTRED